VNVVTTPRHVGSLGRRQFLAGTAAVAAGLAACGTDRPTAPAPSGDRDVDVAVIGAGIAGLAAAGVVARAGQRTVVLEARDRVGGRIWTSTAWPDAPVDLGASWIHGTDGNPVYAEVNRLGLVTSVFDVGSFEGGGSAIYYSRNGTELDADETEKRGVQVVGDLEKAAGSRDAGRTSLQAALDALPARTRDIARTPTVAAALDTYAGDFGATPDTLALSALDEDDSYPGAQRVFPAGYGRLTQRLAGDLPVRLGTPVTGISLRDRDRVVIDTADGQWRAAKVIVTVPLGVLKSGAITFDPPLPAEHRRAIDAIGFGRFEKLVLRFDTAFWDDVDQIQVVGNPGEAFTGWYNLSRVARQPVLMALNGGSAAAATDGMALDRQTALATDVLAGIYRGRFRPPVAAQASGWWSDEFSRGSYSFTAVGSGDQDREALAEPVDDRMWLAGEVAHQQFHSTVHGAWLSGEAAAKQAAAS
jgi:monoamine oxidase